MEAMVRHAGSVLRLGDDHLEAWRAHRWLVLRDALAPPEQDELLRAAEELEAWPERPGSLMKYFEPGEVRRLCRVEDFLPHHAGLRAFLSRADLRAVLERLLGEPPVLYKEKINFKLPGGQGFAPHQDGPAFASFGQSYHVTLMVSVDATTPENGCLEIVDGFSSGEQLPQAEDGTLHPEVVERLAWHPLPTTPADLVLFDSWVPHRSGPNRSAAPRRAFYVTWNRASEGDRRSDYYQRKRRVFPPEVDRVPGAPLDPEARAFNLGNPIR